MPRSHIMTQVEINSSRIISRSTCIQVSRFFLQELWVMILDEIGLMTRASSRVQQVTASSPRGVPSLVPRLPLSFSHFLNFSQAQIYYTRKIEGEGEPGKEPRPPVTPLASHGHGHGGHALHCAQYHSHAALWIVTTWLRSHTDTVNSGY
jgi:hypothetical protein